MSESPRHRGDSQALRRPRDGLRRDVGPDRRRESWNRCTCSAAIREPWITPEQAAGLSGLKLLVVQDILPSPASAVAHFVLPGGSFAEREGTFVNQAGLAQAIQRAVAPPDEAWPDGRILWQLAGRRGLFHAPTLRQEMAQEIPALAPLAVGDLGEWGVYEVG